MAQETWVFRIALNALARGHLCFQPAEDNHGQQLRSVECLWTTILLSLKSMLVMYSADYQFPLQEVLPPLDKMFFGALLSHIMAGTLSVFHGQAGALVPWCSPIMEQAEYMIVVTAIITIEQAP